ncbi:penicillin-binding protein [Candidatus Saccharibacteria bacterium]|nr:penicillin-binding protein [Candidatus Saccharibacteria bacterium]
MVKKKLSNVIKARKKAAQKRPAPTTPRRSKNNLSLYSNLAHKRKTKKDQEARKRAEYLASLPKNPFLRALYRLHPKRFWGYWFSKRGFFMMLKITGVTILVIAIGVFALFAYFRRELDAISPGQLARRVQTTVSRYYDRNGILLWEDRGIGNYRIVVEHDEIAEVMRQAIIAVEDRDFFNHRGVSPMALVRAFLNNLQSEDVQGGSTLTQQLVKQVFMYDEAHHRGGFEGYLRKIREIILAIEIERMYSKEQILTLYLNESPFGGRRNGVESAARTYFGISASELNLPQAALLAAIPNNPAVLDPYNVPNNHLLIARQHRVLDDMVIAGFITRDEAEEAKAYPILDTIRPESDQFEGVKAPHFVLEVRRQLEEEFGIRTIRQGGLTIYTTLDWGVQYIAQAAVYHGSHRLHIIGADNIAHVSIDNDTGQVLSMVGSVDFHRPGFGANNAATSPLEPGSAIKSIVGYAGLFEQRQGINFGPGSNLRDENIDHIYCRGAPAPCTVQNATRQTFGDISIRNSLAMSLNRPAVLATYIVGIDESLRIARELGAHSYCMDNPHPGLAMAIGGGCAVTPADLTNAYASLARNGVYKPQAFVLEVTNSDGEVLKAWEDTPGVQVINPQAAFLVTDILADRAARSRMFANPEGFTIPGVWTATKTGTTDNGRGQAKDSWMMTYSATISSGVWAGVHDGGPLTRDGHAVVAGVTAYFMEHVHHRILGPSGRWYQGQQIPRPEGIQHISLGGVTDLWPSWMNQNNTGVSRISMVFDSISRRKATECTPDSARVEVEVMRFIDPVTNEERFVADGWYPDEYEDIHICGDTAAPSASISINSSFVVVAASPGASHRPLRNYTVTLNGTVIGTGTFGTTTLTFVHGLTSGDSYTITVRLTDSLGHESTTSISGTL